MENTHGDRLRAFREENGFSQRDLANELGVSQGTIGFVESGNQPPSRKFLEKMRDRFGVSSDWLLHGEGDQLVSGVVGFSSRLGPVRPPRPKPQAGDIELDGMDYSFVRRLDVSASAGPGRVVVSEDVIGQMGFSREFLLQRGLAADLSGLVKAEGDSMEPLIPDGAMMLVGFGIAQIQSGSIYIVRYRDELFVKRLVVHDRDDVGQALALSMVSENPAYPPVRIDGENLRDFMAIGLVATVIKDM